MQCLRYYFNWLVPGSLDKRDFELTSSAGYALILLLLLLLLMVGLAVAIVHLRSIKYVLVQPVLPRGTSRGVPMCLITFLVVILAK